MGRYPEAIGPYSIYCIKGGTIYLSGQLPVDPNTGELREGFEAQCRQSFDNIAAVLEENEVGLDHILKLTIYLSDLSYFDSLNKVMMDIFEPPYPIRTAFQVAALPKGALIEIEAMAKLEK